MRVKLHDGTTYEDGRAGYAAGYLWIYLQGVSIADAFSAFSDPAKTATITFIYGEMSDVYEGFTEIRTLSVDVDGVTSVCMVKGAA